jgi:glycosyltransferase involved in cell wall biosynthesis
MGWYIPVASINRPQFSREITEEEREEEAKTYYVKQTGLLKMAGYLGKTFFVTPIQFFRGLFFALKLRGPFGIFYFVEAVLVGSWMKKRAVSHLHVHFANPASTVGLIVTQIFPFTFSMTVHGPDEFDNVTLNHLKEKIQGAKFVCCIGHYALSQLKKLTPQSEWEKLEIAPLGIDSNAYRPINGRPHKEVLEILSVGRLVSNKGQQVLIEALKMLKSQGRNLKLRLVGDGPQRPFLEEAVAQGGLENEVTFTGALNPDQVLKAYNQADLFVLPSFSEGIPVSLMEAMAMEIPCIATHINGIPELIRHGVDGLLVIPSDAEELANAIASLVDHPERRLALGKTGRQRVMDKYNFEANVHRLADIFEIYLAP